jgi:hypothetical protein
MISPRVLSYFLLVPGTILTALLVMGPPQYDMTINLGYLISLPAMFFGFLGVFYGCAVERRWKEFTLWSIPGILVVALIIYVFCESQGWVSAVTAVGVEAV